MTRLERLRDMRAWIDAEIEAEERRTCPELRHAADLYDVTVDDILSGTRLAQVVRARQAAAWLLHRRTGYKSIARIIGWSDWKTAVYACRKIDADPSVRALLCGLEVVA